MATMDWKSRCCNIQRRNAGGRRWGKEVILEAEQVITLFPLLASLVTEPSVLHVDITTQTEEMRVTFGLSASKPQAQES